jgi:alkylated DNA repair dioxygenase AlkB
MISLDETSWIDQIPGWLPQPDADDLLAKLIANAAWEQRDRWMVNRRVLEPRLTAEYHDLADAPDTRLADIAERLSTTYGVRYDGLWINFYRDHRDSTGWHGDWPTCKRPECVVPVLSLGAPRRFLIKPRQGGRSTGFTPLSGDLIVMGGRAQRDWLHSVPKQAKPTAPRISVNFSSRYQARRPLLAYAVFCRCAVLCSSVFGRFSTALRLTTTLSPVPPVRVLPTMQG